MKVLDRNFVLGCISGVVATLVLLAGGGFVLSIALRRFIERSRQVRRERAAGVIASFLVESGVHNEMYKAVKLYVMRVRSLQVVW